MNRFSRILIFSFLLTKFFFCNGQDSISHRTFIENKAKWEFGYNPLFWTGNSVLASPYTFIIKKYDFRSSSKVTAYRFKISTMGTNVLSNTVSGSNISNSSANNYSFDLKMFLGKEWDIRFEKVVFFYGTDIMFHIVNENKIGYDSNGILSSKTNSGYYEIGINPVIGGKYLLSPRLSLTVETGLLTWYNKGKTTNKIDLNTPRYSIVNNETEYVSYIFYPVNGIYLSFHF